MGQFERPVLTEAAIQEIRSLYSNRFREYGVSVQTVGWSSEEQQKLRFQILSEIGSLQDTRILDVGCGLGDFFPFLKQKGYRVQFTGIDLCPELVGSARQRFPEANFKVDDILKNTVQENFDWVFLSGALNYRIENNWDYTQAMLKKMFALANRGVACNFLTSYVDYESPPHFHHHPEQVFEFVMKLTRKVVLRHDYPLWEFTVYLNK